MVRAHGSSEREGGQRGPRTSASASLPRARSACRRSACREGAACSTKSAILVCCSWRTRLARRAMLRNGAARARVFSAIASPRRRARFTRVLVWCACPAAARAMS